MEPFLLTTYLAASLLALATSALAVIQFHEHVRFARSRLCRTTVCGCSGRAMLIVPCCGRELGLDGNLRGLFRQTYSHYMIRFVVESVEDTAYPIILRLIKAHPGIEAELIVAGPAEGSGQKIHNLLAATAEMPLDVKYLAFADSDARPRRQWLSALLSGLDRPNVAATTGYRWFLPARPSLTNHLLHSINGQVAMFLGNHSPTVVWGGAWAIRRELFELLDLRMAWAGKVCEDLVAGSLFRKAGFRVVYEPACMVMSPIDTTVLAACAFIRRQYLFVRCYDPCVWALIVSLSVCYNLVFWSSLIAAVAATLGAPWPVRLPAMICALLYSLSLIAGMYRSRAHAVYCPRVRGVHRTSAWVGVLTEPLAHLVHGTCLLASAAGRWITWRGISYQLDTKGRVVAIHREIANSNKFAGESKDCCIV